MYKKFLTEQLLQISAIARDKYGTVSSSVKPEDNNQVLTEADIAIGEHLVAAIQRTFPAHNVIDEEAGVIDNGSNVTWVVDPIDGTSNFAAKTPLYGCMVGVLENDIPVAGGVVLPSLNELYVAEKGTGATCNGEQIHVSSEAKLSNLLISYGIDGHREDPGRTLAELRILGRIILTARNLRSSNSVFDLMAVARGSYGAFLNQTTKIWDNVAPQIIIEEAGGVVTDFYGQPMDYHDACTRASENFTICAGSVAAHLALQEIITHKSEK